MKIIPLDSFDREKSLTELLQGVDINKLKYALKELFGGMVRLSNAAGKVVFGEDETDKYEFRTALSIELEPIGYLEHNSEQNQQAVTMLLEMILKSSSRYQMASDLHIAAVHADFEKLQQQHKSLQESEARYKELSENLELRVQEQVKTLVTTQRQLYQAEKLSSVGQLAAGVAHEINNPIGFLRSNLNTANGYVKNMTDLAKHVKSSTADPVLNEFWHDKDMDFIIDDFNILLEESIEGADRVARIVSDLRDFSNIDNSEEELVDINQTLRSVCNVATNQINQKAELVLELGDLPTSRCQPGYLGQVFLNLLLNSLQAIQSDSGEIKISSDVIDNEIIINVSDNGCGIAEDELSRIFEPFYTSHDVGVGTGLGLTVCRDIIHSHDGDIKVQSEVGKWTIFTITLPIKD
ncbi:MAG: two-component system NtrC family sensor kinase [Enterobacterales bacterium]|jgi:two-component system NtrC family sensor kinase